MEKKYKATYWNHRGAYQKQYDILWNKYLSADNIRTGNAEATRALKKLRSFSRRYYRFYNDGDSFTYEGRRFTGHYTRRIRHKGQVMTELLGGPTEMQVRELEKIADKLVLDAWRKTNGGTLPLKK